MGINSKQAKEIPIQHLLEAEGHQPLRQRGRQVFYLSPFRKEKDPSFNINIEDNTWYDFGEGAGGTIIDLAIRMYNCDVREALRRLEPLSNYRLRSSASDLRQETMLFQGENLLELVSVNELKHPKLLDYLRKERKLDIELCKLHLDEVYFRNKQKNKIYFAVGWKNEGGGYEIRNPFFKSVIGQKSISLYPKEGSTDLYLFEGITDFLSLLTIQQKERLEASVIILNSLSFLKKSLAWAESQGVQRIASYFDNDEAGAKANRKLNESTFSILNQSNLYQGHKDLNEYLISFSKQ